MSILRANFKHLYQHRGLWLYYFLLALFVYQMFHFRPANIHLIWGWYVLVNFMAALAVGMLQREILSKPFTYSLPGHRPVPRRIIAAVGLLLNAGLSFLVLIHPDVPGAEVPLVMAAAFSLGLGVYLLAARSMFTLSDKAVPYLVVQLGFMWLLFVKGPAVDRVVLAWPEAITVFGLAACVALWMNLRRAINPRKFCGRRVQNLGDFSRASIERNQRVRRAVQPAGSTVPARVETAFLDRIGASRPLSAARCIWGDLYVTFAALLSWTKGVLLLCVPAAVALAFLVGRVSPAGTDRLSMKSPALSRIMLIQIVVFASLMPTLQVPLPIFSSMLLTRGRRERFKAMISIALAMALFVSSLLAFITACTAFLQLMAPGVFGGLTHLFGGLLTLAFLAAPFALVPLGLAVRLIARYLDMMIVYVLVFCLLVLGLTVRYWFDLIGVPLLVGASVCCWAALVLAGHRICTRRSFTH